MGRAAAASFPAGARAARLLAFSVLALVTALLVIGALSLLYTASIGPPTQ